MSILVKIFKCNNPHSWYYDSVGESFEVEDCEDSDYFRTVEPVECQLIIDSSPTTMRRYINKNDCRVLEITSKIERIGPIKNDVLMVLTPRKNLDEMTYERFREEYLGTIAEKFGVKLSELTKDIEQKDAPLLVTNENRDEFRSIIAKNIDTSKPYKKEIYCCDQCGFETDHKSLMIAHYKDRHQSTLSATAMIGKSGESLVSHYKIL